MMLLEVRTGRPVVFAQHTDRFIVENDKMDSDTVEQTLQSTVLSRKSSSSGKEIDRIAKSYPWLAKDALVGGPKKIKSKPCVYKIQHSMSLRIFAFSKNIVNKHVTVVQRFLGP